MTVNEAPAARVTSQTDHRIIREKSRSTHTKWPQRGVPIDVTTHCYDRTITQQAALTIFAVRAMLSVEKRSAHTYIISLGRKILWERAVSDM
jgi:hypothetical protein